MKVQVTQADIDKAKKVIATGGVGRSRCCPIAQAIRRKLHRTVSVADTILLFSTQTKPRRVYEIPTEAKVFMTRFDWDKPVEPIEFEVKEKYC